MPATLSWTQNAEPDLAGYFVYRGISPGVYGAPTDVGLTATPSAPSHTFTSFPSNGTWYFAVSAYDTSNNESAKSNEVSKQINDFLSPSASAVFTGPAPARWTSNVVRPGSVRYGS